jgi:uncharacterized protein YciI
MTTFAVTYVYDDRTPEREAVKPAHRAFLADLFEKGSLLASGPVVAGDKTNALIILSAESADDAAALLANDPNIVNGFVAETSINEWTVVYGPW